MPKAIRNSPKRYSIEALAIYRSVPGDQRLGIATTLGALSGAAQWSGNFANAEQLVRDSMNLLGATVGRNHPDYAAAMANLGLPAHAAGKVRRSGTNAERVLADRARRFRLDNQRVASIEANLGTVYEREGDPVRAMKMTQDALRIISERLGPEHYRLATSWMRSRNCISMPATWMPPKARRAKCSRYTESRCRLAICMSPRRDNLLGEVLLRRGKLTRSGSRTARGVGHRFGLGRAWRLARRAHQSELGLAADRRG